MGQASNHSCQSGSKETPNKVTSEYGDGFAGLRAREEGPAAAVGLSQTSEAAVRGHGGRQRTFDLSGSERHNPVGPVHPGGRRYARV